MPTRSISPPPGAGASSSASISSSAASLSLRPLRSKNLTPLYSGGLCDAEMTTPRSRRSSATAGVGTTPASTADPPADATPRANASSSSSPEPRVSRPTKTRPPPDQSADALPSRSTSSGVISSPTMPRTPSVPKYSRGTARDLIWRLMGRGIGTEPANHRTAGTSGDLRVRLALGELRSLAGLVQAGLLALHLAGIPRQVALALERHAQLRVRLDEGPGDAVAHSAGLPGEASAMDADPQVICPLDARRAERRSRH